MTGPADTPRLDVDDEVEYLLDALDHGASDAAPGSAANEIVAGLMREPVRGVWGMGRALARLIATIDAIERERGAIMSEYERRLVRLREQARFLDRVIGDHALAERARTGGQAKYLDVPGVGRWQTRERKPGLALSDVDEVIAWLSAEGREELRAQYVVDEPRLRGREFRAALDEIVKTHGGELPDGVVTEDGAVTVSGPWK